MNSLIDNLIYATNNTFNRLLTALLVLVNLPSIITEKHYINDIIEQIENIS